MEQGHQPLTPRARPPLFLGFTCRSSSSGGTRRSIPNEQLSELKSRRQMQLDGRREVGRPEGEHGPRFGGQPLLQVRNNVEPAHGIGGGSREAEHVEDGGVLQHGDLRPLAHHLQRLHLLHLREAQHVAPEDEAPNSLRDAEVHGRDHHGLIGQALQGHVGGEVQPVCAHIAATQVDALGLARHAISIVLRVEAIVLPEKDPFRLVLRMVVGPCCHHRRYFVEQGPVVGILVGIGVPGEIVGLRDGHVLVESAARPRIGHDEIDERAVPGTRSRARGEHGNRYLRHRFERRLAQADVLGGCIAATRREQTDGACERK